MTTNVAMDTTSTASITSVATTTTTTTQHNAMTSQVFNNSLMTTTTASINTTNVQDHTRNITLAEDTDTEEEEDIAEPSEELRNKCRTIRPQLSSQAKQKDELLDPCQIKTSDEPEAKLRDESECNSSCTSEQDEPDRTINNEGATPQTNNNSSLDTPLRSDHPLKGTILFVDVRAENENRSKAVSCEVEKLGGVVVNKINSQVTHVVYKEGRNATLLQLRKFPEVHLVSVLWVDACKTTGTRVDEGLYTVKFSEGESSPFPAKARRVKSLQPKTLEEDINNSGKKAERRRKRLRTQGKSTGDTPPDNVICMDSGDEQYLKSSDLYKLVATPKVVPDTPWMLNYVYAKDGTPGRQDSAECNDGSRDDEDASFTCVAQRSPRGRGRCSTSSVLSTRTLPRRLSKDLEESNESFEIISPTQKFNVTDDFDVISPTQRISNDCRNNKGPSMTQLPAETSPEINKTGPSSSFRLDTVAVKLEPITNVKLSGTQGNSGTAEDPILTDEIVAISDERSSPKEPSPKATTLKEISANEINHDPKKKKKKKKLLSASELVPFADSPLADEATHELRQEPVHYQKSIPKGSFMNASLAINNVESSKLLQQAKTEKLKKQRKNFLKAFPIEETESPNGSFKTKEHLQLRAPDRTKKKAVTKVEEDNEQEDLDNVEDARGRNEIKGNEAECANLVEDMSELQMNESVTEDDEDVDDEDKENAAVPSGSRNRRSSGVDFKIAKKFRNISLKDRCGVKEQQVKKQNQEARMFSSSSDDENSNDDAESVGSNVSFIHDEKEGLIILSQEENTPLRSRNNNNNNNNNNTRPQRKDVNVDSGISDGEENNDLRQKTSTRKTLRSSFGGGGGVGKSPKVVSSRMSRRIFSPYNSTKVKSSLVSTSLHLSEQTFLKAMLKQLGGFVYRTNVSNDTTHVIAGSERRTLNILYAIVYGCWILNPKWISDSVEEGKWLRETEYEMIKEFPLAKKARVSRSKQGKSFLGTLFSSLPPVYVSDSTSPPSHELTKLINLCGGSITNSIRKAGLGVGTVNTRRRDLCTVSEKWVLDCITQGDLLPTKDYENFVVTGNASPGF